MPLVTPTLPQAASVQCRGGIMRKRVPCVLGSLAVPVEHAVIAWPLCASPEM